MGQRTRHSVAVAATMGALGLALPVAHAADAEVEALKAELAAQRKLIEQLLANQKAAQAPAPSAASTTPAAPSSGVKFYGVVDVSVNVTDSGFGKKTRLDGAGGARASRIGVEATRDLGGGLSAIATAEAALQYDNGTVSNGAAGNGINTAPSSGALTGTGPQLFARQIFGGLSGGFGTVTLGRQYTGSYFGGVVVGSVHGDGFMGNAGLLLPMIGGMPTRVNNSIVYKTPRFGGTWGWLTAFTGSENNVSAPVAASATTTTNDKAGRGFDLAVFHTTGPFNAGITAWDLYADSWVTAGETGLAKKKGYQVVASYNFGPATVHAMYLDGTIKGGNYENVTRALSDAKGYGVGVKVPLGNHTFVVGYGDLNDRSSQNRDATIVGLTWWYTLPGNTRVYASLAKVTNNQNASYRLSDAANLVGTVSAPGVDPKGFQLGMNWSF
jgi:predicted porin